MESNKTYEEAVTELEQLVRQIEDPSNSLTQIEKSVAQAMELIGFCREKLKEYEGNMEKLANFEEN